MALMVDNNYEGILLSLDSQKSVPAPFLTKTYQLVDDPNTDRIVSWGDDESTFVVWRPPEFARDLLPNYFKHSNFSSFVRQLNTYGFRKIVPERWEFANEFFRKGEKHLLCEIHRRRSAQPQTAVNHHHHLTGQTYFHYPTRLSISPPDSDESQQPITSNNWCDSPPPPLLSPSAAAIGSVTALSEDNERLRRNNNMLVSELAHMRRLYDDIIYFVQNHVKPVYPSDSYSSSLFLRNSSSKEPCSHVNYANSIRDNRVLGSFNTNYSSSSSPTGNILPTIIDELGNNFEQPNNCRTKLFGVPLVSKKRLHPECNSFSSVGTMTNKTRLVSENNGDDGYLGLNLMPPSSC